MKKNNNFYFIFLFLVSLHSTDYLGRAKETIPFTYEHCSLGCGKIPNRSNLRKEGFIGMQAISAGKARWQCRICNQEVDRDKSCCPAPVSIGFVLGPQSVEWCYSHLLIPPSSASHFWKEPHTRARGVPAR